MEALCDFREQKEQGKERGVIVERWWKYILKHCIHDPQTIESMMLIVDKALDKMEIAQQLEPNKSTILKFI